MFFARVLFISGVLLSVFQGQTLMAQSCTGCTVSLPSLPADTIYYTDLPTGIVGVYYDATMSIRVPQTTTPINAIDPGTPAGLTISSYTFQGITGLPPGLSSYVSQTVINPANNADICIRVCGTPLVAGNFSAQAQVVVAISVINQNYNLTFDILIEPAVASNDLFELDNIVGCGSLTTNINNFFESNGNPGYSYTWDFGNGQSSTAEQPGAVTFNQPGNYDITLNAAVDTIGYLLQAVTILSASCSDNNLPPFSYPEPDIFIEVFDAGNALVFVSPVSNNVSFPFAVGLPAILMQGGNYKIRVWDEDLPPLDANDLCGEFTITNNSNAQIVTATTGATLTPNILHPVFNYTATNSVTVHALPADASLSPTNGSVCANSLELSMTPQTGTPLWYLNNQPLVATGYSFNATQAGSYSVSYFDANGCLSGLSNVVDVSFLPLPVLPTWSNNNFNMLVLDNGLNLPANYALQWYFNNTPIPGATTSTFCITESGTYALQLTNLATGCINTFTNSALYNPTLPCINSSDDALQNTVVVLPNPTTGFIKVLDLPVGSKAIRWYNSQGQFMESQSLEQVTTYETNLESWPHGVYQMVIISDQALQAIRVIKL
jgi:hypothetical protein